MSFSPEFVATLQTKMCRNEILDLHKAIKNYTKKQTKKENLELQLGYLLRAYEMLYNKLNKMNNPNAQSLEIDKSKLKTLSRDELYGIHMCMRKCMKFPSTKQDAINNLISFAKQVHYFITY